VSTESITTMPTNSLDTYACETQGSMCHRRVASDASVTFRGLVTGSPRSHHSGGAVSAPGGLDAPKKKSKFRLKKLFRRVTRQ
jgi:hypothetical protein